MARLISDQIFAREVMADSTVLTASPADAPFRRFHGRFIRAIHIARADVFERYDDQTGEATESSLGHLGNLLHVDSHDRTIEKYLLFRVGDRIDPEVLADTERLLRSTPFILDTRIDVWPAEQSTDSVDVVVITRDRWSIGFNPRVHSVRSYDFNIEERNLAGLGHQLRIDFDVDLEQDRTVGYTGRYTSDNLQGTFIRGQYRFIDSSLERAHLLRFSRDRVAPQIRFIGSFEMEYARRFPQIEAEVVQSIIRTDVWVGRAFSLGTSPRGGPSRTALTPAVRLQRVDHQDRPEQVTAEENRGFRDRLLGLSSLSVNRSRFRRTRLIRGYGRTEDLPYGFLVAVTGGVEHDEFEDRAYFDVKGRFATYFDRLGYLSVAAGIGGYRRAGRWEDNVFDAGVSYFTPIGRWGGLMFRHFLRAGYTRGTLRRSPNGLTLDSSHGLIAVEPIEPMGDERLVASVESVDFIPLEFLGFRLALFEFLGTGAVGSEGRRLEKQRFNTIAGLGLRFHNERLIFNPLELRFALLLSGPESTSVVGVRFGTVSNTELPSLDPGAPSILPFN